MTFISNRIVGSKRCVVQSALNNIAPISRFFEVHVHTYLEARVVGFLEQLNLGEFFSTLTKGFRVKTANAQTPSAR